MKQCGIYIIKNKINEKVYIGQSVDIVCRWAAHKNSARSDRSDSYVKIHKAMKELGVENFYMEVVELCDFAQLSNKEKYWIQYYDSYINGYNMTLGGESNFGETNGRAILKEEQVLEIRLAYGSKIPFREVYEKYKGTISKRGLQKVWHFETWRHILPEVYTDENRKWHTTYAKANISGNLIKGMSNQSKACSDDEILKMRELRKSNLSYKKIAEMVGRSPSVVRKCCLFQECRNSNRIKNSICVKNVETGLVFNSITEAAKWGGIQKETLSKYKNTTTQAGTVPTTGAPAHWTTL